MVGIEERPELRRILLALDAAGADAETLDAVARMAAALEAELVGIFIEDQAMLAAADLPMTWSWPRSGAGRRPLDARLMERALRVTAARASEALASVAARRRVRWSFRVASGDVSETVFAEAAAGDLLALASRDRALRRRGVEALQQPAGGEAGCSLLLLRGVAGTRRPIVALYDGSARVLDLALRLAEGFELPLRILAVGRSVEAAEKQVESARDWLADRETGVRIKVKPFVTDEDVRAMIESIQSEGPGLVVADRQQGEANEVIGPLCESSRYSVVVLG